MPGRSAVTRAGINRPDNRKGYRQSIGLIPRSQASRSGRVVVRNSPGPRRRGGGAVTVITHTHRAQPRRPRPRRPVVVFPKYTVTVPARMRPVIFHADHEAFSVGRARPNGGIIETASALPEFFHR